MYQIIFLIRFSVGKFFLAVDADSVCRKWGFKVALYTTIHLRRPYRRKSNVNINFVSYIDRVLQTGVLSRDLFSYIPKFLSIWPRQFSTTKWQNSLKFFIWSSSLECFFKCSSFEYSCYTFDTYGSVWKKAKMRILVKIWIRKGKHHIIAHFQNRELWWKNWDWNLESMCGSSLFRSACFGTHVLVTLLGIYNTYTYR